MRAAVLAAVTLNLAAQTAVFESSGMLSHLVYDGQELDVRAGVAVTQRSRANIVVPGETSGARDRRGPDHWNGALDLESGARVRYEQTVTSRDGKTEVAVKLTADSDVVVDGLYYFIRVPWEAFAGGVVTIGDSVPLGRVKAARADVLAGESRAMRWEDASRNVVLSAEADRSLPMAVRDEWDKSGHFYSAWLELRRGPLKSGETAAATVTLSLGGKADHAPVALLVDSAHRRYPFDGFGGNYCFDIESATTSYTLKNLKVRWARTEMTLLDWAPENDRPGSRLRHEFELAKRLQDLGIPYVISIWQVPDWAVAEPGKSPFVERHRIAFARWDRVVEAITSYLQYAKRKYGVEPDLFSFNEANIGINVLLTPEEHREVVKSLGRRMAQLGLKTKMLLGDATGPAGTHVWALAAANDPEVRPLIGAVAFHSWQGGTAEQYKAWGDLADWLNLPLLVTELGVDPFAWRSGMYDSYDYGLHEVRMYQELLLHARPRGTMQWEFTGDYGLVHENGADLTPTGRFWLVKHFTDLTPWNSEALETASDHKDVLVTALASGAGISVHIANLGAARTATIRGLPAAKLRIVRTIEAEGFKEQASVTPERGELKLDLAARSLLTLTTVAR